MKRKFFQRLKKLPFLNEILKVIVFRKTRRAWRKANMDNGTVMGCMFPISQVTVGKYTYGPLNVKYYGAVDPAVKLEIGNFVSLASDIWFLLKERHHTVSFTTFPLKSIIEKISFPLDSQARGSIIVEDHVWIGVRCTILSGVRIGKGSIIGAGSVVTKDVPPYSVVMGNPAQVVKMRFSEDIIAALDSIDLSRVEKSRLIESMDELYKEIRTVEDVERLRKRLLG